MGLFKKDKKENSMPEKHRLLLDFPPESYRKLEQICEKAGGVSEGEAIGNALRLYEWYVGQMKDGWKLCIKQGEKRYRVDLIF